MGALSNEAPNFWTFEPFDPDESIFPNEEILKSKLNNQTES